MSQWGQAQPGYQYPLQTGFQPPNPQFQQQNPQFQPQNAQFQPQNTQFQQQNPSLQQPGGFGVGGLVSQPTGFPAQRLQGFQQPQQQQTQTGFQASGFLQSQPTGYPQQGAGFQVHQAPPPPPPPPPVPSLPTQYQRPNQGPNLMGGLPQQQQQQVPGSRFLGPSPAIGAGLASQPTGFVGRSGIAPLVSQPTGFLDPRLQMMTNTFMPVNQSSFGTGAVPQVAPPQYDLQQSFQQHNQVQRGTATPQMSWALSKAEKKQYNDIFRSWDAQRTGFISGQTALEVFGASGLPKDDLARIWTLADIDDRGKLNIAEFHVAMGLIYRRLSGMPVPDKLPPELVPPSARDLDNSVDLVKDLLKYETRTPGVDTPVSRLKNRSFNTTASAIDSGRDATIYKHSDSEPPGGFYQPRSRHVNRDDVRSGNDSDSPSADLSDLKRRLANTAEMLERTAEADASRTAEDEELDREMDDLKYRVKRVSDDLEFVSRGPRTSAKDQERRQLERELLTLMHEKVPEVERKMKIRDERKEREKRQWARDRDRANEKFGRYDDRDRDRPYSRGAFDRDRPYSRGAYDRDDRDRSYSRGAFDRDERDRDRDEKDYSRDSYRREESRSRERPRSPPAPRSAPPVPSATPSSSTRDHPAPTPPKATPSPSPMKNMTPEERRAYAREEAKRMIEARKLALGVTVPSSSPSTIDTSVEDRLQREKKEAEEKARIADQQAQERERTRNQRLESEKAAKEVKTPTPTRTVPAPAAPAPAPTPRNPPTASKRAPAPPPPRKGPAVRPPVVIAPPAPKPPVAVAPPPPPQPEIDPEEEALRAREEAIRKQREARAERLRQLEKEEQEAARKDEEERRQAKIREERAEKLRQMKQAEEEERLEEERYQERLNALKAKTAAPHTAPAREFSAAAEPAAPPPPKAPSPPPAAIVSPQPPKAVTPAPDTAKSTNPFSRLIGQGAAAAATSTASTTANGSTNPWARPQTAPPSSVPNPSKSPVPAAVKTSYNTAPSSAIDEDWDDIKETEGDESSDDEFSGRSRRENIARQLFGNIIPSSRPQSADIKTRSSPTSPAPPPPPPSAPPATGAPPPPAPPPSATLPPITASPGDRSGLMGSIQAGLKLRPARTVDKSGPPVSGRVLGDTAPPPHINAIPRPASPPRLPEPSPMAHEDRSSISSHRQSVGWFADRAADVGVEIQRLPSTREEDEEDETAKAAPASIPAIHVDEAAPDAVSDHMADIDKTITHRVRTLYAFDGEGPDDLSFEENYIITANPSKSGGDWWFGTLVSHGKSGIFPKTYVDVVKPIKAKALYSYAAGGSDEVPFTEGDELTIIDTSEEEWWKTEQGGMVFIVPAAYLETVEEGVTADCTTPLRIPTKMVAGDSDANASLSDGSRTSDSLQYQDTHSNILGDSGDEDSDTESDSSDYLSFEESDGENIYETKVEREARAHERQLVLEAAGLILTQHDKPPPALVRARSYKRRPAPLAPHKRPLPPSISSNKDLPPVPQVAADPEPDHAQRLDDAFDRYESFKKSQHASNRMSMASTLSEGVFPPSSPTPSPILSRLGETRSYSNILNFLGRSRTPEERERNTGRLSISAPIMQGSGDSVTGRSGSSAFGSSWASLVDKAALEGIPSGERSRQEAIFEVINTESAYVRDLQLIVEVFYSSMLPLLSQKEVTVVFANVEDLLLVNTAFLSSLEERQKECRLYVDKVGDILLNHIPNMAGYMQYCVNHPTAIKVLKSLRDSNPDLAAHLQRLRDDPAVRNLDLSSYLLVPMQRITRYPLLIKQILTHTDAQDDERRSIQKALDISEKLLNNINEAIRDQEGRETLRMISQNLWIGQGRLDLTAPTRYMGPRKLIKEGTLTKAKSGRKLYGFLCSDILVLTDASMKTLYKMPVPLAHARVKEAHPYRDGLTFQVSQAYPRGGDSLVLKAPSVRDCRAWMQEIEYASRRCRHVEERAAARKAK